MTDNGYIPIGVDVDEQSFADLNRNVDTADTNLGQLVDTNKAIADSADDVSNRLQSAFSKMRSNIDDNINAVAALRTQVQGLGDDTDQIGNNSSGGGDGSGGGGISGLRRSGAILNRAGLGVIGQPLQIAGEAEQLTKTFGDIGDSLKGLTDAGGPATDIVKSLGGDLGVVVVAGGLAVAALGAIAVAGAAFKSELDKDSESLGNAVTYVDDYYKAIEKGTTDSINLQLKELQGQQILNQEKEKTLQASYDAAHPNANVEGTEGVDIGAILTGAFNDLSGGGKQLNKDLEDTKNAVKENDIQQRALKAALGSTEVAANDAAEAEKKLQAARDANADKQIQIAQQTAQLEATGTTKQIQDRVAQIEAERVAIGKQIEAGGLSEQETNKLQQQLRDLAAEEERDTVVIGPLIAAREKEAAAIDASSKFVTDRANAVQKQNEQEVAAVDKYNAAIQAAEDNAAQARINANQKLQDALVNAAQKASDAAQQALEQLEQKQAQNLLSLDRDLSKEDRTAADQRLNDQIKAQRQEAQDLQTHLDNLKQIRDRDAGRERDDELNRNYRDLFALKEQKTQDIKNENDHYVEQEQKRQEALQQQEDDQSRAEQVTRRERLIAYQQQQQDAQRNYEQSLQQADQAHTKAIQAAENGYQRELRNLSQSLTEKEQLLRQDAINQLKLITQTEDEKLQIFNNSLQQVNQLLGLVSSGASNGLNSTNTRLGTGSSRAVPFADGGYDQAGQLSLVNDKYPGQRESFNNSMFPPGLGLFIPVQGGNISSGKSGGSSQSMSNTFYITSNDPQGVRREVLGIMKELTK